MPPQPTVTERSRFRIQIETDGIVSQLGEPPKQPTGSAGRFEERSLPGNVTITAGSRFQKFHFPLARI
jgi:hypothetical protein